MLGNTVEAKVFNGFLTFQFYEREKKRCSGDYINPFNVNNFIYFPSMFIPLPNITFFIDPKNN